MTKNERLKNTIWSPIKSPTPKTILENAGGLMPASRKEFAILGKAKVTRNPIIIKALTVKIIGYIKAERTLLRSSASRCMELLRSSKVCCRFPETSEAFTKFTKTSEKVLG